MSDERFARQYRFGPPSGFPLTSSCTSIDHHLSGPNLYALARHFIENQVLPEVRLTGPSSRLLYASGFTTLILAHKLDSLVRVSRRVGTIHKNSGLGDAQPGTLYATKPTQHDKASKEDKTTQAHQEESIPLPHSQAPYQELHSPRTRSQLPSSTLFSGT